MILRTTKTVKTSKPAAKAQPISKAGKIHKPDPVPAGKSKATKQAYLIYLLQQPEGRAIQELVEALDWQPHTVRAAMTRLRQSGHSIERSIGKDSRVLYRLNAVAA